MKRSTRIGICLLCLLLAVSILAGCKKNTENGQTGTQKRPTDGEEVAPETPEEQTAGPAAYELLIQKKLRNRGCGSVLVLPRS